VPGQAGIFLRCHAVESGGFAAPAQGIAA